MGGDGTAGNGGGVVVGVSILVGWLAGAERKAVATKREGVREGGIEKITSTRIKPTLHHPLLIMPLLNSQL